MTNLKEDAKSNTILVGTSNELIMQAVNEVYAKQKATLGLSQRLLDFRHETTIERIKHGRHGRCDCGGHVDEEALKTLEVFCPACLTRQSEQKAMLEAEMAKLQNELREVSSSTKQSLRENNQTVQSSHEADTSPSTFNSNLTIRIPGLKKRIEGIDEALQKVPFGTYGFCEECEEEIPLGRLKVVPHTLRCVTCQDQNSSGKVKNLVFTQV